MNKDFEIRFPRVKLIENTIELILLVDNDVSSTIFRWATSINSQVKSIENTVLVNKNEAEAPEFYKDIVKRIGQQNVYLEHILGQIRRNEVNSEDLITRLKAISYLLGTISNDMPLPH